MRALCGTLGARLGLALVLSRFNFPGCLDGGTPVGPAFDALATLAVYLVRPVLATVLLCMGTGM